MAATEHLERYARAGRRVVVDGVATHVCERGEGPAVLCVHGVPVSGFVYRKLLPELAARGLRGLSFDLPGAGLADRPTDFDYRWTGLGRFATGLVDALGLERVHLVVHDIGGPVGFEVAAALPDRVASLTVLNTLVEVSTFRKPWTMRPFEVPGIGEAWLGAMVAPLFVELMYAQGIAGRHAVPAGQLLTHLALLRRGDGGRAFLRTMRGFETTAAKEAIYTAVLRSDAYPVQAVWGSRDPALRRATYGEVVRRLVGPERFCEVAGKHFVQETHAAEIAARVAAVG